MSGNLWMFSDKLDDEDMEILKHEFITYYQGADYYGLGLKMFTKLAHEAGAVYKIGKKVLIRRTIFDAYLRKIYRIDQEKAARKTAGKDAFMKQGTLVDRDGKYKIICYPEQASFLREYFGNLAELATVGMDNVEDVLDIKRENLL